MKNNTDSNTKGKFKEAYIVIIILIALTVVSVGLQLWESSQPYPGNDKNVEVIEINEIYEKDDLTFTITEMELGDHFAVVYYQVLPAKMILPDGLQLYNNGELLRYNGASSNSDGTGYVAYDAPKNIGELEIRINTIEKIDRITHYYPLEFDNNKAQVEIEIEGNAEVIEIKLLKDSNRVYFAERDNILNYTAEGVYNDIHSLIRLRLVKDDISTNQEQMCKTFVPDELRFDYYDITYSDDIVIIPVT